MEESPAPNNPLKGGIDEKDEKEMGVNAKNQTKQAKATPVKHFMTPTISAVSKSQPPMKKVLAERNESTETTPVQLNPKDLDSRPTPSTVEEIGDSDNVENALLDYSSSRPYDPVRNYLTPRPRFLRFKPNRRSASFLDREREVDRERKEGLSSKTGGASDSTKVDSFSSLDSEQDDSKQEREELGGDEAFEEEEADVEEGRSCWGLNGAIKFLLLLVMVVLCASFISNANDFPVTTMTPSPIEKAVMGLKDGYQIVQDQVYGFVKNLRKTQNYFSEFDEAVTDDVETDDEFGNESDATEVPEHEYYADPYKVSEWDLEGNVRRINWLMGLEDLLTAHETNTNKSVSLVLTVETEALDMIEDDDAFEGESETTKRFDPEQYRDPQEADNKDDAGQMAFDFNLKESEDWLESSVMIDSVDDDKEMAKSKAHSFDEERKIASELAEINQVDSKANETGCERIIRIIVDAKSNLKLHACFFMSLLIEIGALIFYCKRSRRGNNNNKPLVTESSVIIEPTRAMKKCTSMQSEENKEWSVSPALSTADSEDDVNLKNEVGEKDEGLVVVEPKTQTPYIELLSEFDVGDLSFRSARSGGIRSSRVLIDSEVDSHSVSFEHSTPLVSSSSCGRFTDEKILVKKPRVGGQEKQEIATPVRRSSRIRNRSSS